MITKMNYINVNMWVYIYIYIYYLSGWFRQFETTCSFGRKSPRHQLVQCSVWTIFHPKQPGPGLRGARSEAEHARSKYLV